MSIMSRWILNIDVITPLMLKCPSFTTSLIIHPCSHVKSSMLFSSIRQIILLFFSLIHWLNQVRESWYNKITFTGISGDAECGIFLHAGLELNHSGSGLERTKADWADLNLSFQRRGKLF